MNKCLLYDKTTKELLSGSDELITVWNDTPGSIIWFHVAGAIDKPATQLLRGEFGIHPLALQDAARDRHPPKLEEFEACSFLIFKTLTKETTTDDFQSLQNILFVGDDFLVTRSSKECPIVQGLLAKEGQKPFLMAKGPDAIASRLLRLFIDRYLDVLLQLETKLEVLEDSILEKVDDTLLAEVMGYKASLKRLRRIFLYHEAMLRELRTGTHKGFNATRAHELNDVYEQQERASSLTLLYYELASDLIDGYLSLSSHRLNQIMKVLTIVTVVFVPVGFLAGIYGMNFENMPELQNKSGYYILLSTMATIAVTILLVLRKKRWL